MSTDKEPSDAQPVEVVSFPTLATSNVPQRSSKLTKKHGLIAVVTLLVVGLAVTCVLVAIRLYTDGQIEVVKYSMTYKDNNDRTINQTVSVDENSVIYHIVQDGVDAWVVRDFDKNIQIIKAKTSDGRVACYATPLNRSMTDTPDSVPTTAPIANRTTTSQTVMYSVLMDPINDIKFLGRRASDMCYNIPTYWQIRKCDADTSSKPHSMVKRDLYHLRITIIIIEESTITIIEICTVTEEPNEPFVTDEPNDPFMTEEPYAGNYY